MTLILSMLLYSNPVSEINKEVHHTYFNDSVFVYTKGKEKYISLSVLKFEHCKITLFKGRIEKKEFLIRLSFDTDYDFSLYKAYIYWNATVDGVIQGYGTTKRLESVREPTYRNTVSIDIGFENEGKLFNVSHFDLVGNSKEHTIPISREESKRLDEVLTIVIAN